MLFKKVLLSCFALLFSVSVFAPSSHAQDQCVDVLLLAAKNTFQLSTSHSISSAAKSFFCSDSFYRSINNSSLGLSVFIPIEGIPVDFKGSKSDQNAIEKREQFCSSSSSRFDENDAVNLFSQVIEPSAIQAWTDCMTNGSLIQIRSHQVNGEEYVLKAKLNIRNERDRQLRPTVYSIQYSNAEDMGGDWKENREVNLNGLFHRFRRVDDSLPMTVFITTSEGASSTFIVQPRKIPENVGSIQASWDEPYTADGEPQDMYISSGQTEYLHNMKRYAYYDLTLDIQGVKPGDGYLKDPQMNCIWTSDPRGQACAHHDILELKITSYKTAYVRWRTSSYPTQWRLAAKWIPYVTKYKKVTSKQRDLVRGSQFTMSIPRNAMNIKIFGKSLDGSFEYTPTTIRNNRWLNYNGVTHSENSFQLDFDVNLR